MDTLNKWEVKLSDAKALRQAMNRRRMRGPQDLADATMDVYMADRRRAPRPIKRQIISHLLNGKRVTVSSNTADAIEEALGVPRGSLFVEQVVPAASSRNRRVA